MLSSVSVLSSVLVSVLSFSFSFKISRQKFFPIKKNVHIYFLVQSGAVHQKKAAPASGFKKKK